MLHYIITGLRARNRNNVYNNNNVLYYFGQIISDRGDHPYWY